MIKYANFQLYRVHPDRVIWKKLTIDDKYIYKQMSLTFYTSNDVPKRCREEKNIRALMRFIPLRNGCLITFKKCVHETEEF